LIVFFFHSTLLYTHRTRYGLGGAE